MRTTCLLPVLVLAACASSLGVRTDAATLSLDPRAVEAPRVWVSGEWTRVRTSAICGYRTDEKTHRRVRVVVEPAREEWRWVGGYWAVTRAYTSR